MEGLLAPAQEAVALTVALVFHVHIVFQGAGHAGAVHLDGVVDDHLRRDEQVDQGGIVAQGLDGITHSGQVDHAGHACEVLHEHPSGAELDLPVGLGLGVPVQKLVQLVPGHRGPVLVPQQILGQDAQAVGQVVDSRQVADPVVFELLGAHLELGTTGILCGF